MDDRTKQIVQLALNAPELLKSFGRDPKAIARRCGLPEQAFGLLDSARSLIQGFMDRPRATTITSPPSVALSPPATYGQASSCTRASRVVQGQGSTVAVVGIVGLASLVGMLTATGVVAVVAVNRPES